MKITKKVLIASLLFCFLLISIFLIYLSFLNRSVIYIDRTASILITKKANDSVVSNQTQSSETQTPNPPGVYSIGMHVYVSGTGGDGLRLRAGAGLDQNPLYLGAEGEQFEIIDGPQIIDNSIWWKIRSYENTSKEGWAVQDFLNQN